MKHPELAVVEARWWKDGNDSVRPLFDTLAGMHHDNPFHYHYEMFADEHSFCALVKRLGRTKGIHYLHVASHGSKDGKALLGAPDLNPKTKRWESAKISRTKVKNAIVGATADPGSSFTGIYFGSCYFGNPEVSDYLFSSDATKLRWIAGYQKTVNWVDAAILEMFFWDQFRYFETRGREEIVPPIERVVKVAEQVKSLMSGLRERLAFDIYVRKKGAGGGVKGIIKDKISAAEIA